MDGMINHIFCNTSTDWLCNQLGQKEISYFRQPFSNQVANEGKYLNKEIVGKYGLVPDTHHGNANWHKIVVMEHVMVKILVPFVNEL